MFHSIEMSLKEELCIFMNIVTLNLKSLAKTVNSTKDV